MEILQQSAIKNFAIDVATLKDEIFVLGTQDQRSHDYAIYVYDRIDMADVKDAIQLPEGTPLSLDACNASNCVYMVHRRFTVTISRITRDDDNQFQISSMISGLYLPNPTLSVTANGDLILSRRRGEDRAVINVYSATGVLQNEMNVPMYISRLRQIVPKSNGNIVLISAQKVQWQICHTRLTEIDVTGTVVSEHMTDFQFLHTNLSHADRYGRMIVTHNRGSRISLFDSHFNLLQVEDMMIDEYFQMCHYNSERNEIVGINDRNVLFVFRFIDQ